MFQLNKNRITLIFSILVIFLSWFLINYIDNEPYKLQQNKGYLVTPFLWSILFIYLYGKEHFYIAINAYAIFLLMLLADILNFGEQSKDIHMSYVYPSFLVVFTFVFFYQEFFARNPRYASIFSFIVAIILYSVTTFYIAYAINFNTAISKDVFFSITQTNLNESLEFVIDYISPIWIGITFAFIFLVGVTLLKQEKKETLRIEKSLLIFMTVLFAALSYNNRDDNRLYSFAKNSFKEYFKELDLFYKTQEKLKADKIQFQATKNGDGETYIIVIGESLNKKHMGLYGYMRDTTPLLNKHLKGENSIVFNNTFSSHTHTVQVLTLSLTEANQINGLDYYESLSIFDVLKQAGVETYWLTNQVLYGAWDNPVTAIVKKSDNLIALNHHVGMSTETQKYDGEIIEKLENILENKTNKNRVIFIHLMGNHAHYCSRYPEDIYSIYSDDVKQGEFGKRSVVKGLSKNINCYDNSIVYNDYVVSSLLNLLQNQDGVTGFIYMSDHADDVLGQRAHNSGKFTYEMTQVPMVAWFSDLYKSVYSEKYTTLKNNSNALYSNAFLYDTLIGLTNIETIRYDSVHDLSSDDYKLPRNLAYTLHGKKLYTENDNYIWWQKINTQFLIDSDQSSRLFPHRVNSIGKLKDIWNDGFRSFEVDVMFSDYANNFQVGHNQGDMGGNLENLLSSVKFNEIKRVWLDLKNLDDNNYKNIIKRLEYLDSKLDIKEKLIIESGTTYPFFKELKSSGWHISYYAPTEAIVKMLEDSDVINMERLAIKMSSQSEAQNLSAISFDSRLYPFIKKYLEPLLRNEIIYHVWYGPAIYSNTFQSDLLENKLFLDKRIKTILVPYKSQFNL